jgi:hypothetical protein
MPSFPGMYQVWRILEQLEMEVIGGAPVGPSARHAASRIELIVGNYYKGLAE